MPWSCKISVKPLDEYRQPGKRIFPWIKGIAHSYDIILSFIYFNLREEFVFKQLSTFMCFAIKSVSHICHFACS